MNKDDNIDSQTSINNLQSFVQLIDKIFCNYYRVLVRDDKNYKILYNAKENYLMENTVVEKDFIDTKLLSEFDGWTFKKPLHKKYRLIIQQQQDRIVAFRIDIEWDEKSFIINKIGQPPLHADFNSETDFYYGCSVDYELDFNDEIHDKWLNDEDLYCCPGCH